MNEHITPWLETYHDGELKGRRLRQVEDHLAHCAACRMDLERLQTLSVLLQESPAAEGLTPPDRFVAQVGLRLPRRPSQPAWQRTLEAGWRLVPVGLFGAWVFVQAVFAVSSLVMRALRLGLGGDVTAKILPPAGTSWLAQVAQMTDASLGDVGRVMLRMLGSGGPLGWGFTLQVLAVAVIGLLYASWLASWWARRRHRNGESIQ
jgi:anti-sigma factor RsiW